MENFFKSSDLELNREGLLSLEQIKSERIKVHLFFTIAVLVLITFLVSFVSVPADKFSNAESQLFYFVFFSILFFLIIFYLYVLKRIPDIKVRKISGTIQKFQNNNGEYIKLIESGFVFSVPFSDKILNGIRFNVYYLKYTPMYKSILSLEPESKEDFFASKKVIRVN